MNDVKFGSFALGQNLSESHCITQVKISSQEATKMASETWLYNSPVVPEPHMYLRRLNIKFKSTWNVQKIKQFDTNELACLLSLKILYYNLLAIFFVCNSKYNLNTTHLVVIESFMIKTQQFFTFVVYLFWLLLKNGIVDLTGSLRSICHETTNKLMFDRRSNACRNNVALLSNLHVRLDELCHLLVVPIFCPVCSSPGRTQ